MTKKFTYKQVLRQLEAFVAIEPDRVAFCHYLENNEPECIVGKVVAFNQGIDFLREGLDDSGLTAEEGKPEDLEESWHQNARTLSEVGYTSKALKLLTRVQRFQDSGDTWSRSLALTVETFDLPWDEAYSRRNFK